MNVYLAVSGLVLDDSLAIRDYIDYSKMFKNKNKAYDYLFETILDYTKDREDDDRENDLISIKNILKKNISEESKLDEIKRYIPNYLLYEVFEKTIE